MPVLPVVPTASPVLQAAAQLKTVTAGLLSEVQAQVAADLCTQWVASQLPKGAVQPGAFFFVRPPSRWVSCAAAPGFQPGLLQLSPPASVCTAKARLHSAQHRLLPPRQQQAVKHETTWLRLRLAE